MRGSFWRPSLLQLGLPGFLMIYGGMGQTGFPPRLSTQTEEATQTLNS